MSDWRDASSFQGEVETHDQVGELLRILWRKVWSGLPPASEAALLPQGMQGQLPCKKGEGLCARQKVVELPVSRNIAISARMSSADDVRFGSLADMATLIGDVRFTPKSGHQSVRPRCPLSANSGHGSKLLGLSALCPTSGIAPLIVTAPNARRVWHEDAGTHRLISSQISLADRVW